MQISLLLEYVHRVKSQYLSRKQNYQERGKLLEETWLSFPQKKLPLAEFQIEYKGYRKMPYRVLSVDSSPIDLSRHRSIPLKALSLARVVTDYEKGEEIVEYVIQDIPENDEVGTLDFPLRELAYASEYASNSDLIMVDGSLIRWQWWQLEEEKRLNLVKNYSSLLQTSSEKKHPVLGVIDRSLSRDITHLMEVETKKDFVGFVDTDLFHQVLHEDEFSPVFVSYSPITKLLPEYKIAFCYYRKWNNILRLEFLLEKISGNTWQYFVDQIEKGKGFPWNIARAHDLCVVKDQQKHMLENMLTQEGLSQKEVMKQKG